MLDSEYVVARQCFSLDALFEETCVIQPALYIAMQHRVVGIRSRATWRELLFALSEAEHILTGVCFGK